MSIGHKLDTNPTFAEAITNSQITNTGRMETNVNSNNMYNIRVLDHSREGLKQLKEFVVPNAMHTGEVRAEPLGCDEGTRQAIFDDILSWILDPRREKGVLWLRGPVGTGKSAIAKTTADRIDNEISCGEVAGSFFFFRGDSARNNLKAFVATLAYRLAVTFPSVGEEIIRVIESDPLVLQAHLDVQWRKLIIEPVISAPTFPAAVIIIDGLDECEDEGDQLRVLDLVRKSCEQHFRPAFLIASRPEPHITNTFHTPPLMHWCRPSINLGAIDIDGEMRKFIRARFLALYHRHIDILQSRAVDGVWPAHADVNLIALRAGGQYIYPLTLFRFLSQSNGDPHLLLQDCLRQDARAFIFLDKLYIHVMKSSHKPDNSEIGELLFLVIESATTTWNKKATLRDFDLAIVTNPENPSRILLRRLHSVLAIPSHYDAELAVHHQSFSDFLLDPYRSKSYYINKKAYALRIVEKCLMRLEDKSNMTSSVLQAICQYWWRCSTLLDRGDLSECVVALMVKLDFDAVVMHMVRDFRSLYAEEEGAYLRFVDQCQHWNYPELLVKFDRSAFSSLQYASWFQLYFQYIWQTQSYCLVCLESNCFLSWKGLMALGKAYTRLYNVKKHQLSKLNLDGFVGIILVVLTNQTLVQMLSSSDLKHLKAWSMAWNLFQQDLQNEPQIELAEEGSQIKKEVFQLLQKLPKEYHYHGFNNNNVSFWLTHNQKFFSCDTSNLFEHWKADNCFAGLSLSESKPSKDQWPIELKWLKKYTMAFFNGLLWQNILFLYMSIFIALHMEKHYNPKEPLLASPNPALAIKTKIFEEFKAEQVRPSSQKSQPNSGISVPCLGPSYVQPPKILEFSLNADGYPLSIPYNISWPTDHRILFVDLDAQDLVLQIFVDGALQYFTTNAPLDKSQDCGQALGTCISGKWSWTVLDIPAGSHEFLIHYAGQELDRNGKANWGEETTRRFALLQETCEPPSGV